MCVCEIMSAQTLPTFRIHTSLSKAFIEISIIYAQAYSVELNFYSVNLVLNQITFQVFSINYSMIPGLLQNLLFKLNRKFCQHSRNTLHIGF